MKLAIRAVVVAALAFTAVGVPASAEVGITDELVLEVRGGRVEIQPDPVRLTFTNDAGEPVLAQSPPTGAGVLTVPETIDPQGTGVENPDVPRLHAPFPFLVGAEELTQYRFDPFQGNLQQGTRAGVLYSATKVAEAERVGDALRLTLETTDPSGRVLEVSLRPRDCCAIEVDVTPVPADGVAMVGDSFVAGEREGFFGFGGRHFEDSITGGDPVECEIHNAARAVPTYRQLGRWISVTQTR